MEDASSSNRSKLPNRVKVFVAGEPGTGKSSLILGALRKLDSKEHPKVVQPSELPKYKYPDHVPVTLIDTPSSEADIGKLSYFLREADAIVLTYACDKPRTLYKLFAFWFPNLQ